MSFAIFCNQKWWLWVRLYSLVGLVNSSVAGKNVGLPGCKLSHITAKQYTKNISENIWDNASNTDSYLISTAWFDGLIWVSCVALDLLRIIAPVTDSSSHTLNHTLLYYLFYYKWDHNLQKTCCMDKVLKPETQTVYWGNISHEK